MADSKHSHGVRAARGFSIVELLTALAIAVTLAALAYPVYRGQVVRSRRTDAIAALLTLQQSQERWRGNHASYGSMADIDGMAASAVGSDYITSVTANSSTSYVLVATAVGAQAQDRPCAVLKLSVAGGVTTLASGADSNTSNMDTPNRRCWIQ